MITVISFRSRDCHALNSNHLARDITVFLVSAPFALFSAPSLSFIFSAIAMTSIGVVTQQIAALEISGKKTTASSTSSTARPLHSKQPSQNNVTKLLTKFAAPNPFANSVTKTVQPSSLRHPISTISRQPKAPAIGVGAAHLPIDIGRYDGGLEIDNEKRGEKVFGEAAEDLALDSSVSRWGISIASADHH